MPRRLVRRRRRRRPVRVRKHAVHANVNVPELTKAGSSLQPPRLRRGGEARGASASPRWCVLAGRQASQMEAPLSWSRFAEVMNGVAYGRLR